VEAYRALVAELDRGSPTAEVYARLYWLATTAPEVDPERPAAEWLTRGMSETGIAGVLLELYRSELQDHPGEAASPRAARLLAADHPAAEVAAFARLRWQGLCRLGQWDVIRGDYDRVHEGLRAGDEAGWLGLISDLATWIAWGRHDAGASGLARLARRDVRSLEHLALRYPGPFDQLDWLDAVARSCHRFRDLDRRAADFVAVLRDGWLLPSELLRRPLEEVLAQISGEPVRWVELFDRAGPDALAALNQFGNLLGRYQAEADIDAESPHPPGLVRELARRWLGDRGQLVGLFRAQALRFCLDEAIDPGIMRTAFHPHLGGPEVLPDWVAALADDAPLHYVCWACRLFRA
jgi:hypothetical protein